MRSLLLLASLSLAACSGGETKPPEAPKDKAADNKGDAKPAEKGPPQELNVYIWTNYHSEAMVKKFEEKFNAKVTFDLYDNNEVIEQKLQSGSAPYDIIVPTDYMVSSLAKQGLLNPLDEAKLPNLKNLDPNIDRARPAGEPRWGVPYLWGTTGYAYRKDKIPAVLDSWNAVFDPAYKGKILMLDDVREDISAALRALGKDANSVEQADIDAARDKLIAQKKLVLAYDSSDFAGKLKAGDVHIAHGYSGELANVARESNGTIVYVVPKEGATLAVDNLAIPKAATHVDLAYQFINFMLEPEVAADTTNVTGYATANAAAKPMIKPELANDAAVFPPADVLAKCQPLAELGDKTPLYDAAWTKVKAN